MIERILGIIRPLFAVVTVGFLYARRHRPDMGAATTLNMDVFVPALVFSALASKDAELGAQGPLALGGLVLGSGVLAWVIAAALRLPPDQAQVSIVVGALPPAVLLWVL